MSLQQEKRLRRRSYAVIAIMALVLMALAPTAGAAGPKVTAVASGLDNPRGLAFGPEGALYVTEAGTGGTACGITTPEGEKCWGHSGAITRVFKGKQERVADGLPSMAASDGSGAIGPVSISFQGRGNAFIAMGLGNDPAIRSGLGEGAEVFGHLVRMEPNGRWFPEVDVAGFEAIANPAGGPVDSNPNSVLALSGKQIVVDAGGNDLLQISNGKAKVRIDAQPVEGDKGKPAPVGRISTLAIFPTEAYDLVPTSVALGPDGAYYVGILTGFPFPVGAAKVYRVPAGGGTPEEYAAGFTNIIGVAFGRDGSLYVLEIAQHGLLSGNPSGALFRVPPGGGPAEDLNVPGLFLPGGLAVGPDGALYVSNYSVFPGQGAFPGHGEVLRIEL
jgi:hypothetical protein